MRVNETILAYWDSAVHQLSKLPLAQVLTLLSIAGLVTSLVMVAKDHTFAAARVRGLTQHAFDMLVSGFISLLLLQIGLFGLQMFGKGIPDWAFILVPSLAGSVTATMIYVEIKDRRSFKWNRFVNFVVIPLVVPAAPTFSAKAPQFMEYVGTLVHALS
jgi:hypothetical protein